MNKTPNHQTVIIQDIADNTITVNINGEIREIHHQLEELKQLLKNQKVEKIQYAEKIYNIEHINQANFGFLTGKRLFNEQLTKQLIINASAYSKTIYRFSSKVAHIPNWESQARISDKAKEIIAYSFVGVIGVQLSKLMAIGKEAASETKQRKYIKKCLNIAKRSLDLVIFAQLSRLWDIGKKNTLNLSDIQTKEIGHYLDLTFEPSIEEQFKLLCILQSIFLAHQFEFSIPELKNISKELQTASDLEKVCTDFQAINQKLDKLQFTLLDCFEAEKQLAAFFQYFAFLVDYNMASIKRIGYRQLRFADPRYLHRYAALGIDNKANIDAEKVFYTPDTVNTDSVLLYKGGDYQQSTNLFPFVIDYNALTFEHGAKVCFYRNVSFTDDSLDYLFLEDNDTVNIEKKGILKPNTDYNELMLYNDKRKILNLDNVVISFKAARKTILERAVDINLDEF